MQIDINYFRSLIHFAIQAHFLLLRKAKDASVLCVVEVNPLSHKFFDTFLLRTGKAFVFLQQSF